MKSGEPNGYDVVFVSPHKFLGGPGSPGVLLMSDALYRLKDTPPSTSGGGTVVYVGYSDKDTLFHEDLEEREDAGTPAIVQKIRAALAFHVKEHVGYEVIRDKEVLLARKALDRLTANPNLFLLSGGDQVEDRQPIFSFMVYPEGSKNGKHLHCRFVTILFNDLFGIQARGGCACAGPYVQGLLGIDPSTSKLILSTIKRGYEGVKPGFTRVSFSYYSSPEETDFVLDAIDFVAKYGHHFLSLYKFDWRTGDWHFTGDKGITGSDRSLPKLTSRDVHDLHKNYIRFAEEIVEKCSVHRAELQVPREIDPTLVNFMT